VAKNLSTFAVAEMLHVDPGSVANWVDQGLLKAHRTPGGHRRVSASDLVIFLREHKMPIPETLEPAPTRVLVVDDEPAIAELVSEAIRAAHPDFDVQVANDGFKAGTILSTMIPDLVVLDLMMPGLDGFEVCKLIKTQDSTKHTEVIAMTGFPSQENVDRIVSCGARACLAKPLEIAELIAEVDSAISTYARL
jgi:excisionase family DNA binding protein